jgi:hypothetical protein
LKILSRRFIVKSGESVIESNFILSASIKNGIYLHSSDFAKKFKTKKDANDYIKRNIDLSLLDSYHKFYIVECLVIIDDTGYKGVQKKFDL